MALKFSEGVEWAIHLCMLLAIAPSGSLIAAPRLASFYELSPSYLAKHLQTLSAAGIVKSVPGRSGGYSLGREPSAISFLDIFEAIEGLAPWFRCEEIRRCGPTAQGPGEYGLRCSIALTMWEAEQSWRAQLASTNLFDATDGLTAIAGPAQHKASQGWLENFA